MTPPLPTRRRTLATCAAGLLGLACHTLGLASDGSWPTRPVRLVVSYAPGNVTDQLARVVADQLAQKWQQPVTVDNKPGQGGSIGAQLVSKAPADGHTLLFSAMAAMTTNDFLYPNVGYKPLTDFVPIANVAYSSVGMLVVSPSLKVRNFEELLAYSRANPTGLNFGSAGNGTIPHLNMEALKQRTGLIAQHVPYRAAAAVMTDVIGGRLQLQYDSGAVVLPQIKSGKLVPIAVSGDKRHPELPDVPLFTELIPGYQPLSPWLGLFAPAGTSSAIVDKVSRDVRALLNTPAMLAHIKTMSLEPATEGPAEFAQLLRADHARLGPLVKSLNLKVD